MIRGKEIIKMKPEIIKLTKEKQRKSIKPKAGSLKKKQSVKLINLQ